MINGYTSTPLLFTGIVTTNTFNTRLQQMLLSASSPAGSIFSLCYDFHLHVAVGTPCNLSAYATGDDGNVFQIVSADSTRSVAFAYDPLNRISQANTVTTTGLNCWSELYTIDPWGNLTNRAGVPGMTVVEPKV